MKLYVHTKQLDIKIYFTVSDNKIKIYHEKDQSLSKNIWNIMEHDENKEQEVDT